MDAQELEQIKGQVEHVVFRNDDTGFTVVELSSGGELVTVVGEMIAVEPGEELAVLGYYTVHPSFGPQFKAELVRQELPADASAILKYLSSGAIKGIGPVTARRLVEYFGDKTLEIMEREPERLKEVAGFSGAKVQKIAQEAARVFGIRSVMLILSTYKITPAQSVTIWKRWGFKTTEILAQNPYLLCEAEIGVSFERADKMAADNAIAGDSLCRVTGALNYILNYNLGAGHTCLPADKLCEMAARLLSTPHKPVREGLETSLSYQVFIDEPVSGKSYIYLPDLYMAEKYCASRMTLAVGQGFAAQGAEKRIRALEKKSGITYDTVQREAIAAALEQGAVIITGGPGTGKTTTVNAIISLLEDSGCTALLCAPTGRAAKRMQELTGREAKTIHRLLEVGFADGRSFLFARNENNPLDCDVLVVDEFSMVDIQLFSHLLKALPLHTRIVLVGDHNQLPSVGPGNLLRDMLESDAIPSVRLQKIFRQAAKSAIITNAHQIIAGEMPDLARKDSDFFFMKSMDTGKSARLVCDLCSTRLPKTYDFSPFWDIQVIAPSKKGEVGTMELNRRLQETLNAQDGTKAEMKVFGVIFREGDKVMQTRNNYDIETVRDGGEKGSGVFNGDIGLIEHIDRAGGAVTVRFDDKTAAYPAETAGQLDLAYAVTVHKSQGSEFEAVIIPLLPGHKNLYFRNLFYTAVTRAKRLLIVIGNENTVYGMVANDRKSKRYSNLRQFLVEEAEVARAQEEGGG